jgi:hypothetical protein
MKIDSIKIRMYRQGLGDCFLLCFFSKQKLVTKMMIDCGTFGNGDSKEMLRKIAQNIIDEFGGKLDVLAVTHEHQDHVYGFLIAQDLWDQIDIDKYWLPWTENPQSKKAIQIKDELKKKKTALAAAAALLSNISTDRPMQRLRMMGVKELVQNELNFQGLLGAAGSDSVTEQAMNYIHKRVKQAKSNVEYLNPGDITALPKATGIKSLILGPPKDTKRLKRMHSSAKGVMYLDDMNAFSNLGLVAALTATATSGMNTEMTFDKKYCSDPSDANAKAAYELTDNSWRKIDHDWLLGSDSLALHIGNYTNNTSLAMAIYLPTGDVLLFPGDAQLGNWESWHDHSFKVEDPTGKMVELTAEDCIRKTILYKASHHASHNGTPQNRGLELMNTEKLVVLVPVDKNDPKTKQYGFPYGKLANALKKKSHSRYIRLDATPGTFLANKPATLTQQEFNSFKKNVHFDPGGLFVEYTLKL